MSDTISKPKMKILQEVKKNFAFMGFYPNQQRNSNKILSKVQLWEFIASLLVTALIILYILCVAKSKEEYMSSIFMVTASTCITASEISLMLKNDDIFDVIEFGENLLFESRFRLLLFYSISIIK